MATKKKSTTAKKPAAKPKVEPVKELAADEFTGLAAENISEPVSEPDAADTEKGTAKKKTAEKAEKPAYLTAKSLTTTARVDLIRDFNKSFNAQLPETTKCPKTLKNMQNRLLTQVYDVGK